MAGAQTWSLYIQWTQAHDQECISLGRPTEDDTMLEFFDLYGDTCLEDHWEHTEELRESGENAEQWRYFAANDIDRILKKGLSGCG
jgi:hypothetical protein